MLLTIRNFIICSFLMLINLVIVANEKPFFISKPVESIPADVFYKYTIVVADNDNDTLSVFVKSKPDWLYFDYRGNDTAILQGGPTSPDGFVSLAVTDGIDTVTQEFTIIVTCYNCCFVFTTTPIFSVEVGVKYTYTVYVSDVDQDSIKITVDSIPDWLDSKINNVNSLTISGTPTIADTGTFFIIIQGEKLGLCPARNYQRFTLTVVLPEIDDTTDCTNCCSLFASMPVTTANPNEEYSYLIQSLDVDLAVTNFFADSIPDWLSGTVISGSSGLLIHGTPTVSDTGEYYIKIRGERTGLCPVTQYQSFNLTVTALETSLYNSYNISDIQLFPNPFKDKLFVKLNNNTSFPINIEIFTITGNIVFQKYYLDNSESIEQDLKEFKPDLYFLRATCNQETQTFKIIKQ